MATVAFIAGPHIFVRELCVPYSVVQTWLRIYRFKIAKAARKAMKQHPPKNRRYGLHISLKEFFTGSWRTIFIRTEANPSPIALAWRPAHQEGPGTWNIIELPESSSVISGGMGSVPVPS